MTSPDGITWTLGTSAADNQWTSVAYGDGLWVAVATSGTGNRIMTSPDGINWTSRTSAADNAWTSIAYGNGLWVAVAANGSGNRIMTSPDGINWTSRTSAADNAWISVAYGNGLWVAVAESGEGDRVMTSPDGINWTIRTSAADNQWRSVAYGNGLWVAVAANGSGNRVMTSPDGITWTIRTSAADNEWRSVSYGNGLWVAVDVSGTGENNVMTYSGENIVLTSHSITSTATIPNSAGSFIVACDESEPVTISGVTYVNYGSFVYKRETNNTYTKLTSTTINDTLYTLYGGDGVNSSGLAFVSTTDAPPPPPPSQITYWSSQADALNGNLSNALGYNDANFTVGQYSSGSSAFTSWRIASNSTGPSSQVTVYVNGDVLTDNGTGGYYFLYPVVPCFLEGSTILALVDGVDTFVPVETLRRGSMVKTYQHGYKAVEAIGYNTMFNGIDSLGTRSENSLFKCS